MYITLLKKLVYGTVKSVGRYFYDEFGRRYICNGFRVRTSFSLPEGLTLSTRIIISLNAELI